ncbi:Dabb family protein [Allonocardiopsis opalescens]|uniref:Stress responsive alpha/beta barrel protein n=1 Tax=Allonocardiopsis opalescens TaxID=1144618 RepID=A0A2T0PVX1_9ACTN|nr:Dabb family protein [Allonocardiopsis opalescens]PRX95679.1 stress responsive alpha/beta barrel protein [Allonocardiopsis opalescens]
MAGVRHVVVFNWTAEATEEQRARVVEALSTLPAAVPEIRAYAFGPDLGINAGGGDFAVVADFADESDYLAYRDNAEHRRIIDEVIHPIMASRSAVQYRLAD